MNWTRPLEVWLEVVFGLLLLDIILKVPVKKPLQ
jgi:hypothetical protein